MSLLLVVMVVVLMLMLVVMEVFSSVLKGVIIIVLVCTATAIAIAIRRCRRGLVKRRSTWLMRMDRSPDTLTILGIHHYCWSLHSCGRCCQQGARAGSVIDRQMGQVCGVAFTLILVKELFIPFVTMVAVLVLLVLVSVVVLLLLWLRASNAGVSSSPRRYCNGSRSI